jgi:putative ABC transport system permease protein
VFFAVADDEYFDAAGIDLIAGRTFGPGDQGDNAERVVVVNEALVRRFFEPGQNPVGQPLPFVARPDREARTRVIGVVRDHRNLGLNEEPRAEYWVPWDRNYFGAMVLVARTSGDATALAGRLAELVERIDPGMPVLEAATLRSLVGGTLAETRTVSTLIAIFGAIALILAAVGLYGVMAYAVAQRTRELGIRIALGARTRDVLGMILRQGLAVAAAGLVIGMGAAFAGLRLLESMLYDVDPADPLALTAGAALLAAVATGAALVPAWRATRVEPVAALKEE